MFYRLIVCLSKSVVRSDARYTMPQRLTAVNNSHPIPRRFPVRFRGGAQMERRRRYVCRWAATFAMLLSLRYFRPFGATLDKKNENE